ncbi:MAG: fasciclin domain-containing protein [Coleofasciculaceae cyanobacterium SM2_3_26]|nr:fasciclin domain-containing protein [Coleofasciculaceae cyanobacterium SM2_3_26]
MTSTHVSRWRDRAIALAVITSIGVPSTEAIAIDIPQEAPVPTTSLPNALVQARETDKTILDIAIESGRFEILRAALEAADLSSVFDGDGTFTLFAPSDEAFKKLAPDVLEELLLPEKRDKLVQLLTYHVVRRQVLSGELTNGTRLQTLQGAELPVTVGAGGVRVGGARVSMADVKASNGVLHVIDEVIIPPGF